MPGPPDVATAINELCRTDLQVFIERVFATLDPAATLERSDYLAILADQLARVERGECRRLLVTIPPRHLKSIATSIALPAWMLGRDPTRRIMAVSYAEDLTREHSRNFQKIMRSGWYAHVFTQTARSIERNTVAEVRTSQNGFRRGASRGGSLTGFGADTIIVDDLMKADDARSPLLREKVRTFYGNTLVNRLNDKSVGTIIAVQQRLHEEDLAAHMIAMGFEHLNLPAIADSRQVFTLSSGRVITREPGDLLKPRTEPRIILDEFRLAMGAPDFEAQYQQNPVPPESALLDWSRIGTYREAPPREGLLHVTQSWDTALHDSPRSDWSVGTTWGYTQQGWLLLDVIRKRLSYPDLLARVRSERTKWQADTVIVERAGTGIALVAELMRDARCVGDPEHHAATCMVHGHTPRMGKEERLTTGSERLYSGQVRFPETAPWLEALRREMMGFPNLVHDDQVDSVTQFLHWVAGRQARGATAGERDHRPTGAPRRR